MLMHGQDWNSTYSDLGKWSKVPFTAGRVEATGVYVPSGVDELAREKRKVALTKKSAAMNKTGHQKRAEMQAASPPTKAYPVKPVKRDIRDLATPPRDPKGKVCALLLCYA